MEWNEREELKGLLAANKRKPVICEKKLQTIFPSPNSSGMYIAACAADLQPTTQFEAFSQKTALLI